MPYIKKEQKELILNEYNIDLAFISNPGNLNFAFTMIIKNYIETQSLSYQAINDVLGALEGAKLEFYRRVVIPYEEEKIIRNGDVY